MVTDCSRIEQAIANTTLSGVRLGHTKNALVGVFTIEAYTTPMSSFFI